MKKFLFGILGLLFAVPAVATNLPAGYTELEYIESSGTQYIDTGVVAKNNIITNCKFNFISSGSDAEVLFGISAGTGSRYWFGEQNGISFIGFNDAASGPTNIGTSVHTVSLKAVENLENALFIDGTRTNSFGNLTNQSDKSIYLFALRSGNAPVYVSSARVYSCSITKNNTLVRDFVPAKNASGVIGMYDTVSGQFFTNAGTGEFVAGPVVPENPIKIATTAYNSARFSPVVTELNDTIATIRSVVTNTINQTAAIADLQATKQTRPNENCPAGKKCLLVEDNDGQPHWYEIIENADGYTELQYVVGGLIDTGLYIKTTDIYELKYATTQDNTAYQFGYRGQSDYASANTFNATYSSGEASVLYIVDSNRNLKQCQFTTPTDTPVVFSWKGSVNIAPSVNGSSISCTGTTNEQTNPTLTYIIGGQNIAGTPQNYKPIKLYYFKVFASDGITLTHNFVPMRRNLDNVIGMYDTITGTFFQSANTNKPFTAGPEI